MRIKNNSVKKARIEAPQPIIEQALAEINEAELRAIIDAVAIPRHYLAEHENNRKVGNWLAAEFRALGYRTEFQGAWDNLIARPDLEVREVIAIGAHYDSVPETPGADDNASGIAAMLACARVVAKILPNAPICFIAFNREEEGLVGSTDLVIKYLPKSEFHIKKIHILEMIGYCSTQPNSQQLPPGLPINIPNTGDFLAILSNRDANRSANELLKISQQYLADLSVINLQVYLGIERLLPVLARSDHTPFWESRIPAILWTDTAEFRNHHYHLPSDTPASLDYTFLRKVTQLLLADILTTLMIETVQ